MGWQGWGPITSKGRVVKHTTESKMLEWEGVPWAGGGDSMAPSDLGLVLRPG